MTCWFIAYFGPNLPPKYPPNKQPNIWPRLILLAEQGKMCYGYENTRIYSYQTRSTHHWLLPALVKRMRFDYFWNVSIKEFKTAIIQRILILNADLISFFISGIATAANPIPYPFNENMLIKAFQLFERNKYIFEIIWY